MIKTNKILLPEKIFFSNFISRSFHFTHIYPVQPWSHHQLQMYSIIEATVVEDTFSPPRKQATALQSTVIHLAWRITSQLRFPFVYIYIYIHTIALGVFEAWAHPGVILISRPHTESKTKMGGACNTRRPMNQETGGFCSRTRSR